MSDATQHDAHTLNCPQARLVGTAMKLICLSREIGFNSTNQLHGMRLRLCSVFSEEEGWLTLCGEVVGTVPLPCRSSWACLPTCLPLETNAFCLLPFMQVQLPCLPLVL